MNGCARASLVPNSTNRQWVVLPPGKPVSVPFFSGLAPPRTPTRIITPPACRSRLRPPPETAMFFQIISRVSRSSIRLAFALAASRITLAPFLSARRMALFPTRSGNSFSLRSISAKPCTLTLMSMLQLRHPRLARRPGPRLAVETHDPAILPRVAVAQVRFERLDAPRPQVLEIIPAAMLTLDVLDEPLIAPLGRRHALGHMPLRVRHECVVQVRVVAPPCHDARADATILLARQVPQHGKLVLVLHHPSDVPDDDRVEVNVERILQLAEQLKFRPPPRKVIPQRDHVHPGNRNIAQADEPIRRPHVLRELVAQPPHMIRAVLDPHVPVTPHACFQHTGNRPHRQCSRIHGYGKRDGSRLPANSTRRAFSGRTCLTCRAS